MSGVSRNCGTASGMPPDRVGTRAAGQLKLTVSDGEGDSQSNLKLLVLSFEVRAQAANSRRAGVATAKLVSPP